MVPGSRTPGTWGRPSGLLDFDSRAGLQARRRWRGSSPAPRTSHVEISMRRMVTALVLAAGLTTGVLGARQAPPPERKSSATRAWSGGATRASACSSTGASMRCRPATGMGSRSKGIGEWIMNDVNDPAVAEYAEARRRSSIPTKFDARRLGRNRRRRGHEIHRHHHQASRRLCDVSVSADRLRHREGHAVQARHPLEELAAACKDGRHSSSASTTRSWTGITRRSDSRAGQGPDAGNIQDPTPDFEPLRQST